MGLFDSEYKTSVNTVTSRVLTDAHLPQSYKTGTLKAIVQDGDIGEHILDELVGGIGIRAEQYYDYGKSAYTYGVPKGTVVTPSDGAAVTLGVIKRITSNSATIEYSEYGVLNHLHYAWQQLFTTYGYSELTNQIGSLTSTKGTPVYLKDILSVVVDMTTAEVQNRSLAFWGTSPKDGATFSRSKAVTYVTRDVWSPGPHGTDLYTPTVFTVGLPREHTSVLIDPAATFDYLRVVYVWEVITSSIVNGVTVEHRTPLESFFDIIMPAPLGASEYVQVKYHNGTATGYYTYKVGSATEPALDNLYTHAYDGLGTFFPSLYFRKNSVPMESTMGVAYATSKALAKKIGIDYKSLLDGVSSNPGIGNIDHAMITVAVPAVTTNQLEIKYLYDFFNALYFKAGALGITQSLVDFYTDEGGAFSGSSAASNIRMIIQDSVFKTVLGISGIFKETKAGTLGVVGFNTTSLGSKTITFEVPAISGTHGTATPAYTGSYPVSVHYYRRQTTDATYEEISVYGMSLSYDIRGYNTVGTRADAILLIPLDHELAKSYPVSEREILYSRSLHYVFTSYQRTEVAWYQTEAFGSMMTFVAIVITVWDMGADNGALISAAATGSAAAIQTLAIKVAWWLMNTVITAAVISVFVHIVGIKLAFVVAIAAALVGLYKIYDNGGIKGAPWAKELLTLSTGLNAGISSTLKDDFASLKSEYDALSVEEEAANKELEKAKALLENKSLLSPFVIFGEAPTDFFNRTVHSGNIGITAIESISSFIDVALTLPTLSESTGDYLYV